MKWYLPLRGRSRVLPCGVLVFSLYSIFGLFWTIDAVTASAAPVIITATDLPANIPAGAFQGGATTSFFNVPANAASLTIVADITDSRPTDMKVIVFPGTDPSDPDAVAKTFVLWNHEQLVDANKQVLTHVTLRGVLPLSSFADALANNSGVTILVSDDTPGSTTGVTVGTFNSCSLIVDQDNTGHVGLPSVQLSVNGQPDPSPGAISEIPVTYGAPVTLLATARGNPSSFQITRLQIKLTKLVPDIQPGVCAAEGGCADYSGAGPPFYSSVDILQTSASQSAVLTYTAPELPKLPPGKYRVAATAWDSAGFQNTTADDLVIIRQLGFFNIVNLSVIHNGGGTPTQDDDTIDVTTKLRIENRMPAGSGTSSNLRVQLIARPIPIFVQVDGPPAIPPIIPLAQFSVGVLSPGAVKDLTISSTVPAPTSILTGNGGGIQWELDAILEQDFGNNVFVPIDSVVILQGEQPFANSFGGPGGAKMNPDPGVNGSPFDPKTLAFIQVNPSDPLTVLSGSHTQYHLTAVMAPNPLLSGDKTVSSTTIWAGAPGGVYAAPVVTTTTTVQLTVSYSIGGVTKTLVQPITVIPASIPRVVSPLANISTRLQVGVTPNEHGIAGFIVMGTAPKKVLIRALGPTLAGAPFNVPGALPDPVLTLTRVDTRNGSATVIARNDDWRSTILGGKITELLAAQIQYSTLNGHTFAPPNTSESAMIVTLDPGSFFNYSAEMSGWNGTSGIGLVEIYDLNPSSSSRIFNISTRGIATGISPKILDAGFIVSQPARLLVRALGPTLGRFGISNFLRDPILSLVNASGTVVASNDNWQTAANANQIPVSPTDFRPPDPRESAILVTLNPGNYTALVSSKDGAIPEIGLVEVYNLQ